jgi:tetratricopeptide (TPR) repeat protein
MRLFTPVLLAAMTCAANLPEPARSFVIEAYRNEDLGRFTQAEEWYRKALRAQSGVAGPDDLSLSVIVAHLGLLYVENGRVLEAERLQLRRWADRLEAAEPDSPHLSPMLEALGGVYSLRGKFAQAEAVYYEAFDHIADRGALSAALNNFGLVCLRAKRYDQAAMYFHDAYRWDALRHHSDDLRIATNRVNLAETLASTGRYGEAEALLEEAIPIFERKCGAFSLRTADALSHYARVLKKDGRKHIAHDYEERVRLIRAGAAGNAVLGETVDIRELRR